MCVHCLEGPNTGLSVATRGSLAALGGHGLVSRVLVTQVDTSAHIQNTHVDDLLLTSTGISLC